MESYAKGEQAPPLLEETIGETLRRTVASHADREALVEVASGRRWTWAELDRDTEALAVGLVRAGIRKGDRVGIWSPNCAEWTITQLATARIGAILVN
jgi:fatty-acyl-CoA synthase